MFLQHESCGEQVKLINCHLKQTLQSVAFFYYEDMPYSWEDLPIDSNIFLIFSGIQH